MKRLLSFILTIALVPALLAVENKYQAGTIVDIQQKAHTRVLYYLVNTPVTQDDPYFEVSIQFKDMVYIAEYTPRHSADGLPDDWKADAPVEGRIEKHHLYLKRPGGVDLDLTIIKHTAAGPARKTAESTPAAVKN